MSRARSRLRATEGQVHVRVYQPRKQRGVRKVDERRICWHPDIRARSCCHDSSIADEYRRLFDEAPALHVNHAARADRDRRVLTV
jgi:hypothetical protein